MPAPQWDQLQPAPSWDRLTAAPPGRAAPSGGATPEDPRQDQSTYGGILGVLQAGDRLSSRGVSRIAGGIGRLGESAANAVGLDSVGNWFGRQAQLEEGNAAQPVPGAISWDDVKARPTVGNIVPFAAEQALGATADVAGAVVSPFAYGGAIEGDLAHRRAVNDNRDGAGILDYLTVAPEAAANVALQRFGVGGSGRLISAIPREAAAQGALAAGDYAATTAGTRKPFSWSELGDQAAQGATMGVAFGVGRSAAHRLAPLRDYWANRGVDTSHLNDDQLVEGSLDGSVHPDTGPVNVDAILKGAGSSPDQFSTPDRAAAAADRVQQAHARSTGDPIVDEVLDAPISPAAKAAAVEGRLRGYERRGRGTEGPDAATVDIGERPLETPAEQAGAPAPSRDSAPRAGRASTAFNKMAAITEQSESGGDANAVSPKGARGPMQTMPGTSRDPGFGVRAAADDSPGELRRVGRDYLGAMVRRYGDPAKAWAAYNWGPGNLDVAIRAHGDEWLVHAPEETQAYVEKNMRALGARSKYIYRAPDNSGEGIEGVGEFENREAPVLPTQRELEQGAPAPQMRTGDSSRPFREVDDDPLGRPGFHEDRARTAGNGRYSASDAIRPQDTGRVGNVPERASGEADRPFEPPPLRREPVSGGEERVVTPRGREVGTRFRVYEAHDLISSADRGYLSDLQPRDRAGRTSSDAQIAEIASRLDPEQLHSSRLASQGAPIVGADRMVESGNGRTLSLRRMYDLHPDKARAYREMIEGKGLSTEGFERPVLVRERTTDLSPQDRLSFVKEANERDTMQMSATEQAKADAGALSDSTLGMYKGGAVTHAGNREFVRRFADEVVNPADRNAFIRSDGALSNEGIRRVRSAMLAKAFDNPDLVERIVEDPDTNIKAIGNTLTDAAGEFAALRARIRDKSVPERFDITPQIGEMASMISRARSEGVPVKDLIDQRDAFSGETHPATEALVRLMFKGDDLAKPRSAADMAEGLKFYTDEAAKAQDGPKLFGDDEAPPTKPEDILRAARDRIEKKDAARKDRGRDLFMRVTNRVEQGPLRVRALADELARIEHNASTRLERDLAARLRPLVEDTLALYGGDLGDPSVAGLTRIHDDGSALVRVAHEGLTETTLHEAVHVATLTRWGELTDGKDAGLANPTVREIEALRQRAQKAFARRPIDLVEIRSGLSNTDEFLAYGLTSPRFQAFLQRFNTAGLWGRFVDGVRGVLGLPAKYGTLLDRVLQRGAELLGEAERTPRTKPGAFELQAEARRDHDPDPVEGIARLADKLFDVDALKGDIDNLRKTIASPTGFASSALRKLDTYGSAVAYSIDGAFRTLSRHFDAPAIADLANMFQARAGKADSTNRTYDEALKRNVGRFGARLNDALKPFMEDKAALGRIRDLLATPAKTLRFKPAEKDAALKVRELLNDVLAYQREAGVDIGEVKDYFRRVINPVEVAKRPSAFTAAAERLYGKVGADDPKGAAEAWLTRILDTHAGLDGGEEFIRKTGRPDQTKAREFGAEADTMLRDFYQTDPLLVLSDYVSGAVRRAEQSRRFAPKGAFGSAERQAWETAHGDKSQWDVMLERIKDELRSSGEDAHGVPETLAKLKDRALGRLTTTDAHVTRAISAIHAWNQLSTLQRVSLSSVGDLAMGFVRGGNARYGARHFANSIGEFYRNVKGADPSDSRRWAEAAGIAGSSNASALIQSRLDANPAMTGHAKLLDGFYRKVGIIQLTDGGRTAAADNGRLFVETAAGDLQSPNARTRQRAAFYLKELGVRDPAKFADWVRKSADPAAEAMGSDAGHAADYATAVIRFADQSVLMPTRAQKPAWAGHPVGSLLFALQSFNAAFTQNVIKRVGRLSAEAVRQKDVHLLGPAAGMFVLAGVTALQDQVRRALFGSGSTQESDVAYGFRILDRMGATGTLSPFLNSMMGLRYHRSVSQSLQGAIVGRAADAADAVGGLFIGNSDKTNSAERRAAGMLYDLAIDPAINAFGASRVRGPAGSALILGTGNRSGGAVPSDREAFVTALAGREKKK